MLAKKTKRVSEKVHTFKEVQVEVSGSERGLITVGRRSETACGRRLSVRRPGAGGGSGRQLGAALEGGPVRWIHQAHQLVHTGGRAQPVFHVPLRGRRFLEDKRQPHSTSRKKCIWFNPMSHFKGHVLFLGLHPLKLHCNNASCSLHWLMEVGGWRSVV